MYDFPASAIDPETTPKEAVCAICGEPTGDSETTELHAHGKMFVCHQDCADAAEGEAREANEG